MNVRVMRANGEASRRRILDAACEIAGERGYSNASISEISKRSGLPNSSIYWHFKDKDALLAAVIEDSYEQWRADFGDPSGAEFDSAGAAITRLHDSLANFPAFLRFGHLVILEQRDEEVGARTAFLRIRKDSLDEMARLYQKLTGCDRRVAKRLAGLSLAMVDGAFLARAAGEQGVGTDGFLARMLDACVAEELRR